MLIYEEGFLKQVLEDIKEVEFISIDFEFIRKNSYKSKPCLMQIGIGEKTYLIDLLSEAISKEAIDRFFRSLNKTKKVLVFFAGYQDLEIIHYQTKNIPKNIIDLQLVATNLLKEHNISLSKLANTYLNKELNKKMQRSNWLKRPLTKKQIAYAENDAKILQDIFVCMKEEISLKKMIGITKGEINKNTFIFDAKKHIPRFIKDKKEKKILIRLLNFREKSAQKYNIRRRFISVQTFIDLIKQKININELKTELQKYELKPEFFMNIKTILQQKEE